MITKENNKIREKIIKGLEINHKKLIQSKKDRNFDLAISENGKVVRVSARDL